MIDLKWKRSEVLVRIEPAQEVFADLLVERGVAFIGAASSSEAR
jgi:hypothetical protein